MSTDDLTAPLGRQPKKRRLGIKIPVPQVIAGALAAFLGVFVLWAVVADDPYGGEPWAVVSANLRLPTKPTDMTARPPVPGPAGSAQHDSPAAAASPAPLAAAPAAGPAPNTTTVTIIDGKTGARQDVVVPGPVPAAGTLPRRPLRSTRNSSK